VNSPLTDSTKQTRQQFLAAVDAEHHFFRLFDYLPGILFFAKDHAGRLFAANDALLLQYGYNREREHEFYGLTDFDLLPRSLAEKFRHDDLRILKTGKPMLEIVEIFPNQQGIPAWFLTNKLPIIDHHERVIGVMGTIQSYESHRELLPVDTDIAPALDTISRKFTTDLSIRDLAEKSGLSVRQFERRFKHHLKTTPQQFIMKMRVFAACDALRLSRKPIIEIATESGFYDQSSFTRQFRKHMAITPLQYRKRYR
jgi:AraC-like DNA-binding protein